jgi:hypothetical protein
MTDSLERAIARLANECENVDELRRAIRTLQEHLKDRLKREKEND